MPAKSPKCPDCSSSRTRPIVYGEPSEALAARAHAGVLVLGGCLISDDSPSWHCADCGNRFGTASKPRARPRPRTLDDWTNLVETMVPAPCRRDAAGNITGGDPVTVIVRLTDQVIHIMEPEIAWDSPHTPAMQATPFARASWKSPASRVAELIILASSKRLSKYRWCPQCRTTHEPEHMLDSVCHGCATKVLGVVF